MPSSRIRISIKIENGVCVCVRTYPQYIQMYINKKYSYVYISIIICTHIRTNMYKYVCICIYIYICTYTYVNMNLYIYMYTQTSGMTSTAGTLTNGVGHQQKRGFDQETWEHVANRLGAAALFGGVALRTATGIMCLAMQ